MRTSQLRRLKKKRDTLRAALDVFHQLVKRDARVPLSVCTWGSNCWMMLECCRGRKKKAITAGGRFGCHSRQPPIAEPAKHTHSLNPDEESTINDEVSWWWSHVTCFCCSIVKSCNNSLLSWCRGTSEITGSVARSHRRWPCSDSSRLLVLNVGAFVVAVLEME